MLSSQSPGYAADTADASGEALFDRRWIAVTVYTLMVIVALYPVFRRRYPASGRLSQSLGPGFSARKPGPVRGSATELRAELGFPAQYGDGYHPVAAGEGFPNL